MIFAPAINTATAGVRREDSGVASALVNTMQQVGGSIGTSALSTIALTATASYLVAHHTSPLAPAIAATHGYTLAFAISAALARTRLHPRDRPAAVQAPACRAQDRRHHRRHDRARRGAGQRARPPSRLPAAAQAHPAHAAQPGFEAIPVALCSCSPVVTRVPGSAATPVR